MAEGSDLDRVVYTAVDSDILLLDLALPCFIMHGMVLVAFPPHVGGDPIHRQWPLGCA